MHFVDRSLFVFWSANVYVLLWFCNVLCFFKMVVKDYCSSYRRKWGQELCTVLFWANDNRWISFEARYKSANKKLLKWFIFWKISLFLIFLVERFLVNFLKSFSLLPLTLSEPFYCPFLDQLLPLYFGLFELLIIHWVIVVFLTFVRS